MAHMQPEVYRDTYVAIETTAGTEIIPPLNPWFGNGAGLAILAMLD